MFNHLQDIYQVQHPWVLFILSGNRNVTYTSLWVFKYFFFTKIVPFIILPQYIIRIIYRDKLVLFFFQPTTYCYIICISIAIE